jgi:hypothetical protein
MNGRHRDMDLDNPENIIPPEFRQERQNPQMPPKKTMEPTSPSANYQFKEKPKNTSKVESIQPKESKPINPLQKYFRTPNISVKLPSGGSFNHPNDIEFNTGGELDIYPMTAGDELVLKNPDSLLNGHAIERVIHSCVPGIKNVKTLPNIDIEVLLLAIKYASYGDNMELNVKCPSCGGGNECMLSVTYLLETAEPIDGEYTYRYNDYLIFYLRPHTFESQTRISLAQFEESKIIKSLLISEDTNDTEKLLEIQKSFDRVTDFNLKILSNCIIGIAVPEGIVQETDLIEQFVLNADRKIIQNLREEIIRINGIGGVKREIEVECTHCQHIWNTPLVYDPSNFFA